MAEREWSIHVNGLIGQWQIKVEVLASSSSDHNPLLVTFSISTEVRWAKSKLFWYEASKAKQNDHGKIIKQVWRVKRGGVNPGHTV